MLVTDSANFTLQLLLKYACSWESVCFSMGLVGVNVIEVFIISGKPCTHLSVAMYVGCSRADFAVLSTYVIG
jgi:hypothetical protein